MMISPPVAALRAHVPALDVNGYADILWLAAHLFHDEVPAPSATPAVDTPGQHPEPGEREAAAQPKSMPPAVSQSKPLHQQGQSAADGRETHARAIAVQAARSLPNALQLARSLRPFKRAWPAGRRQELDIEATERVYAETRQLIPAFRPAPERWFDLVLLIDRSPSMSVWRDTITEFVDLLHRLAAFRQIHIGYMTFADGEPTLQGAPGDGAHARQLRSHGPRQLNLVLTDGYANAWSEPNVWHFLRKWAASSLTALVNPLSTRLWVHTGLDQPAATVVPAGTAETDIQLRPRIPLIVRMLDDDWMPLAAVTLTPESLGQWARTLMRNDPMGCDALLVPSTGRALSERDSGDQRPTAQPAERIVERFHRIASPAAAELAVLCSLNSEITMPVLTLIRQELLPAAGVNDVAELVVGGLVTVHPPPDDQEAPPTLRYRGEAHADLRRKLTDEDAWHMFEALSRHVNKYGLRPGGMTAVFPDPHGTESIRTEYLPFAEVALTTLRYLQPDMASATPVADTVADTVVASDGGGHATKQRTIALESFIEWATWQLADSHRVVKGQEGAVRSVAAAMIDGQQLIISGNERTVRAWDARTGELVSQMPGHTGQVRSVAVGQLDDRPIVVSGGFDRTVRLWEFDSRDVKLWDSSIRARPVLAPDDREPVLSVAIGKLADAGTVIVSASERSIRSWAALDGAILWEQAGRIGTVTSVALWTLAGKTIVVSGGGDRTVRVWDAATGVQVGRRPLTGHAGPVRAIAVGELNGRPVIASASSDKTVRLWDPSTATALGQPMRGHTGPVTSVAIGQLQGWPVIVSGGHDGTVRVWSPGPATGDRHPQEVCLVSLRTTVHSVAISGDSLVVAGTDRGIVTLRFSEREVPAG